MSEQARKEDVTDALDRKSIVIIVPVFNDWKCLALLLGQVESEFADSNCELSLLVVDDASTETDLLEPTLTQKRSVVQTIKYIRLSRNVGHQHAIATALKFLHDHVSCDFVAIMDADGQDSPQDLARIVNKLRSEPAVDLVFGRRQSRAEGTLFRWFYGAYITAFRLLTGIPIRFGHFCAFPKKTIASILQIRELPISFVGTILSSGISYSFVNANRNRRFEDKSKMKFISLVLHGLGTFVACRRIIARRIARFVIGASLIGVLGHWFLSAGTQDSSAFGVGYMKIFQIGSSFLAILVGVIVSIWIILILFGWSLSRKTKKGGPVAVLEQNRCGSEDELG